MTDAGPGFVKLPGNPEGPQALFCELVGTRAAAWLGLPTFELAIVDVAEPALVSYGDGSASAAGPAIVTREHDGTTWGGTAAELASLENPEALSGLVVLDTWLLNCDRFRAHGDPIRRNVRNVFFSARDARKGKFRLVAMDHTHIFTCGAPLTPRLAMIDRVKEARVYGNFPEFRALLTSSAVRGYAERLGGLKAADAATMLQGIPSAWGISSELCTTVVQFLRERAMFLAPLLVRMLVDQGELQPEPELGD